MSANSLWTDFSAPDFPVRTPPETPMSLFRLLATWWVVSLLCAGLGVLLADLFQPTWWRPSSTAAAPLPSKTNAVHAVDAANTPQTAGRPC